MKKSHNKIFLYNQLSLIDPTLAINNGHNNKEQEQNIKQQLT